MFQRVLLFNKGNTIAQIIQIILLLTVFTELVFVAPILFNCLNVGVFVKFQMVMPEWLIIIFIEYSFESRSYVQFNNKSIG